jgi:hypothetical protein
VDYTNEPLKGLRCGIISNQIVQANKVYHCNRKESFIATIARYPEEVQPLAKIELPYVDKNGKTKVFTIQDSATRIEFANKGIATIDLERIGQCMRLRDFLIYDNEIENLDLTPLSRCNLLRSLVLRRNKMRQLDLSPLSGQMEIQRIDLRGNQLQTLNVDPLANHQMLEKFQTDGNPLLELDISALITCRKLSDVSIDRYVKIKASRNLMNALKGPLSKYRKNIIWIDRGTGVADASRPQKVSESAVEVALGVLKSVPRISMQELTGYTGMSPDDTRELVFALVGKGDVAGRFEPGTDEFISLEAVQTAQALKSTGPEVQRCSYCGSPLPRALTTGERFTCPACGQVNEG